MDCEKALELISLRLDGMMTEEEERALDAHLEGCAPCRSLLLDLTALRDAMPEEEEPPEGFLDGVMERVRESKTVPFPVKQTGRKQWKSWAAMAAVFALVIAGAGGLRFAMEDRTGGAEPEMALSIEDGDAGAGAEHQAKAVPYGGEAIESGTPETGDLEYTAAQKNGDVAAGARGVTETAAPESENITVTSASTPAPAPDGEVTTPPQLPEDDRALMGAAVDGSGETTPPTVAPRMAMFSMDGPEEAVSAEGEDPEAVEPALTEAERTAMERLLGELGWTEYTWEGTATAVQAEPQEAGVVPILCYQGLSGNGRYYTFEVRERVYDSEGSEFHTTSLEAYAVPVDGGDTISGSGAEYEALLGE